MPSWEGFVLQEGKQEVTKVATLCKMGEKNMHCQNIRRFYGKITGNRLPVHFPLLFTGARKNFQESGTER